MLFRTNQKGALIDASDASIDGCRTPLRRGSDGVVDGGQTPDKLFVNSPVGVFVCFLVVPFLIFPFGSDVRRF
jgi:hypothetical protein